MKKHEYHIEKEMERGGSSLHEVWKDKQRDEKTVVFLLSAGKGKIKTSDKADNETFFALITVCEYTNFHFNVHFNQMTFT